MKNLKKIVLAVAALGVSALAFASFQAGNEQVAACTTKQPECIIKQIG
ncbi:hypothetical protein [Deinococcus misasensis]|nr:hypothetical protein [Deinococcus misasensis]